MDSLLNTSPLPEPTTGHQQAPTPPQVKSPESASESGERRPYKQGTRPPEPELLPCPRCDSTNTKFCYYNNYNLCQPRHYCKSCRRYWTRGGALRNVPVGGGSRKNPSSSNKRPRISSAAAGTSSDSSIVSCSNNNDVARKTRDADPVALNSDLGLFSGAVDGARSLSCWLGGGTGFFPFNGNGFGLVPGLDYGTGLLDWPAVEQVNNREDDGGSMVVSGESSGCGSTWQIGGGGGAEGGVAEGTDHYISWPDLAISTSAKALK